MACVCLGETTESRAWCRMTKGLMLNKKVKILNQKWVSEVESVAHLVKDVGVLKGEVKNKNVY